MIRMQIYIPDDLKSDLTMLARREKISVADIIRRAVKKEVQGKQLSAPSALRQLSKIGGKGPGDLSTNLFDYLYGDKSDYAPTKKK